MNSADDFDARSEREIIELLAAQPRPSVPPQVWARIESAIAAEAEQRAADRTALRQRGSGRSTRWLFAAAAAAVVVVLAGVVTVPRLLEPSATTAAVPAAAPVTPSPSCPAPVMADADLIPVVTASGTTYTAATLQDQAGQLVDPSSASCQAYLTSSETARLSVADDRLRTCVVRVARGRSILAIDLGWYDQHRSVTVVVSPPKEALAVDCEHRPVAVLARARLP